jgi:hypothetical protein
MGPPEAPPPEEAGGGRCRLRSCFLQRTRLAGQGGTPARLGTAAQDHGGGGPALDAILPARRRGFAPTARRPIIGDTFPEADVKRIAVVQGARGEAVQPLFRDLVKRWRPPARIAGVIAEDHGLPDRKCSAGYLRSIATGALYPIFQDLGPGAEACHLEGGGAVSAAGAIADDIGRGCDLVLLSKFGKLEAAGQGLAGAFAAAIEADVPVLTAVSPALEDAWAAFAGPLFVTLPPDEQEIEAWWRTISDGAAPVCRDTSPGRNADR